MLDTFKSFCLTCFYTLQLHFLYVYYNAVVIIFQVKNTFSPVHQNHYLFTPRDLTRWCLGFLRYNLKEDEHSVDLVLEVSSLSHSLFCMNFIYMYWIFLKCKLEYFFKHSWSKGTNFYPDVSQMIEKNKHKRLK